MDAPADRRKLLWIEVVVALCTFFLPSLVHGFIAGASLVYYNPGQYWASEANRIVFNLACLAPVGFIVWSSGDSLAKFGLCKIAWWRALPWILGSFFVYDGVAWLNARVFSLKSGSQYLKPEEWTKENPALLLTVTVISILIGAVAEEFIMRGYLIPRLEELTKRGWLAALLSTTLFTSYHIYQGIFALPVIFGIGLWWALAFRVTGSLWPGVIAHTLVNTVLILPGLLKVLLPR